MSTLDDGAYLRGWTIQPWEIWERVEAGESLYVDWGYSANLHLSYDWLREQLCRRVPGYSGRYPWWAYTTRPDLRRMRHLRPHATRCVLLELSLPRRTTVVFPSWAWDLIFYHELVSTVRGETEEWRRRMERELSEDPPSPLPEPWRSELYASWERIFEPSFPRAGWRRHTSFSEEEAVFERLDRSVVVRATSFVGAAPNRKPRGADLETHFGPTCIHR